jgi:histidinol phosphatase-like enzyme
MSKIYVDVDGTLLDPSLDNEFKSMVDSVGINDALVWYNNVYVANLSINMDLVNKLIALKEQGYELILWTNRGEQQRAMTEANLGIYWHMFSTHIFRAGAKGKDVLDGMVYDNEVKYLACGTTSQLVSYKAA